MNELISVASYNDKIRKIMIFAKTEPAIKETCPDKESMPEEYLKYKSKYKKYVEFYNDVHHLKRLFFEKPKYFMMAFNEYLTDLTKSEMNYLIKALNNNENKAIKNFVVHKVDKVDLFSYYSKKVKTTFNDINHWYINLEYYEIREQLLAYLKLTNCQDENLINILNKLFVSEGNCSTFEEYLDKKSKELSELNVDDYINSLK